MTHNISLLFVVQHKKNINVLYFFIIIYIVKYIRNL